MAKRILAFCAALMALAVVPTIASASPEVTYPTGTRLATGTAIQATNIGNTIMTNGSGSVVTECTTAKMTGTLTENTGTHIAGDITTATFAGTGSEERCTGTFGSIRVTTSGIENGLPWCITSTKVTHQFEIRGGKCSEKARAINFVLDSSSVGECKYTRSAGILGTYKTHPEDAVVTVSEQEFSKVSGSFLCPSVGKLDMSFTLETDPASGSAQPIYIS